MATNVITLVTDDLDGSEGAATVHFSYQGKSYAIDLAPKNADKLAKALEPWIAKARTTDKAPKAAKAAGTKSSRSAKASERPYEPAQLREWQAATGRPVTLKGRFPDKDIEAYLAIVPASRPAERHNNSAAGAVSA